MEVDYERDRARLIRRRAIAGAIAALLAAVVAVYLISRAGGSEAEESLDLFLDSYEERDYSGAADRTNGRPGAVARALEANVDGLDGAELETEVVSFEEEGDGASATVAFHWEVPGIGQFDYENPEIRLVGEDEQWLVRWRDDVVHPNLDSEGTRLGTTRGFPERAPILDRERAPIVIPRPVVEVGIVRGPLDDAAVERAIDAIAAATEADAKTLRASVEAAESPLNFVPAITLREEEFAKVRDELDAVAGIEFGARELPLAPTKEFARAVLGTVGPITAEQLKELGEPYAVGDNVGQGGLQLAFEERLAGTPDRAVITRRADGSPVETLFEIQGERGKALRTTLDANVQTAAEEALGNSGGVVALAAADPHSGDVLAAASRPVEDSFNRVFEGQYAPGSTFKVITTAALLAGGLDPDEIVDCPPTIVAGGREFRNFEHGAAGPVPFRTDFAESCNTAFISLADRLAPDDLAAAAEVFGFPPRSGSGDEDGGDPAVPTFEGSVPRTNSAVDQAASMIGQGRILASPVAMAGVAATVIDGRPHEPRVLSSDPREAGPPLPPDQLDELRSLMRDVVTEGTGTALADVPGEPIGKSGTAEYGSGDPPPTHAWFIAGRDDIAVAVLVEDKPSGGEFAAPIVARFLNELG